MFGYAVDGGDCELLAAPEYAAIHIPDDLSFEEAAAVPLVFLTAWHMLMARAALQPGEDVLVLAASSGVGSAAIQIAKMFHCRVIATAGGEAKLAKARELGADHVIDHYTQDISAEVKKITGQRGVDVVIEHVGTATWQKSVESLAPAGRLVTCGATTGYDAKARPALPVQPAIVAARIVHGNHGRAAPGAEIRFPEAIEAGDRPRVSSRRDPRRA